MRRYFVEVTNPYTGIDGYWSRASTLEIAEKAGLPRPLAFVSYITDDWGPKGAVYELLDIYTDEEFSFLLLKLNGKYVGRTGITEDEVFPEWVENEPTFRKLYWRWHKK